MYSRMSRVWVFISLLCQLGSLGFTFQALRFDSSDDLEWADVWYYTCDALWPLQLVAYTVVFMGEPTRDRFFGPAQVLSMVLGTSSKALLVLRDPDGAIWHVGGSIFVTAWIAIGSSQRCRHIKAEFSAEQVRKFVHETLPTGTLGILPSMIFLVGESMSCITEKFGVDAESDLTAKMCEGVGVDTYCEVGCNTSSDMYVSVSPAAAVAPTHSSFAPASLA
jgi:hypothetical protein